MLCLNPKCRNILILMDGHITDQWKSPDPAEIIGATIFWDVKCHYCGVEYRVIQKMKAPPTREPREPNLEPRPVSEP